MGELQKRIKEHWDSLIDKWLQKNENPRSKYLLNTCVDWAVEEMTADLYDSLCSWCYNQNEFGCWTLKKKSVENCPRNKLEKWLGRESSEKEKGC